MKNEDLGGGNAGQKGTRVRGDGGRENHHNHLSN